ncbi:unnamed protein product [Ectocarpus sp. CCAP 1310/34]|nr:unnamed protein product [Ectocarpus sp. CCAP 1310/34]
MDLGDTSVLTDEQLMDGYDDTPYQDFFPVFVPESDAANVAGVLDSIDGGADFDLSAAALGPGASPFALGSTEKSVDINRFHRSLAHACEPLLRETAQQRGTVLTGKLEACTDRIRAKGRRGSVPRGPGARASMPLGVDFRRFCDDNGIGVEFTPPGVPQDNGVVERTIWRIMKAGMAARRSAGRVFNVDFASIPGLDERGDRLWMESAKWAADALNQSATKANPGRRSPHEMFTGEQGPFRVLPPLSFLYLNGGDNHPSGTVKVLKASTGRVVYTTNVSWVTSAPAGEGGFRWYQRCADTPPIHAAGRLGQLWSSTDAFDRRTAAASAHAVARSRSRCRFAPCSNAAASDHAAARSHAFTAALCHFAVTVGDPRSWPAVRCRFAFTIGNPRSRPAAVAAGPRDAPAHGSRHAAASPGYKGRGTGHISMLDKNTLVSMLEARSGVDEERRDLGGAEAGEPGGAGAGEQAGALAAVDPGTGGAGFPLALATLLASREDIEATLRDQRPPEQRPDLPHCQASDLRVPKSYKEAMASELTMPQQTFTDELAAEYGVVGGKSVPMSSGVKLSDFDADEVATDFPFRELVGSLMWLATQTRPDIANAVRAVSRYCSSPKQVHWDAAISILGYARRTSHFGILLQRGTVEGFSLQGYPDADFVSKAADHRPVSGGIVTCGGGAVSWFSRTQKCVTLSTTEAEYVALGGVMKEIGFEADLAFHVAAGRHAVHPSLRGQPGGDSTSAEPHLKLELEAHRCKAPFSQETGREEGNFGDPRAVAIPACRFSYEELAEGHFTVIL